MTVVTPDELAQIDDMVTIVQTELARSADPDAAKAMAAYMKTDMPFYGVKRPERDPIFRRIRDHPIESPGVYRASVLALWNLPHREEKYLALALARHHKRFINLEQLDLYKRLIIEGAWWDFVDEIASRLVGAVWLDHRSDTTPVMDAWIDDEIMWLRRTAIIGQLTHKDQTDEERLFRYCAKRCFEKEFFIRKAIGWALREYGKVNPDAVIEFVARMGDELSGLSRREALKHLG